MYNHHLHVDGNTLLNLDLSKPQFSNHSRNQLSESNSFYKSALLQHQQQTHGYVATPQNNSYFSQPQQRFVSQHAKTFSLPIEFQAQPSVFNVHLQQHQQQQQQLPPPPTRITHTNGDVPLPPGWECEVTSSGQAYFINHLTKTTSWEDPRKFYNLPSNQSDITSDTRAIISQISLPDGWEQASTSKGEVYYVNHKTKTTSWEDPRIPLYMQQLNASRLTQQPHQRSSSASSLCSTSSFSSSTSSTSSILFDSTKTRNNSGNKEALKMNLDSLVAQKLVLLKQIDELSKQEINLKGKLSPSEIEEVFRVLESQGALCESNNNKENVFDTSISDEMDTTLITDNAIL